MNALNRLRLLRLRARLLGRHPHAVVLLERMGDIVACGPVAAELKRRDSRAWVVWICRARFNELARAIPGVDEAVPADTLDQVAQLASELAQWQVLDLTLRGKKLADNIREWSKSGGDSDVTTETYYHYGSLLAAMCRGAGFTVADDHPRLNPSEHARREVDALRLPAAFVAVHCTSDESARNWIADGWRALATDLLASGRNIVEIGDKASGFFAPHPAYHDLTGRTSMMGTAELLRRAHLFVGIDSGPAHLANAAGIPGLILLGRYRVFQHYIPYTGDYAAGKRALLLQHHEECPFLPISFVLDAAQEILAKLDSGNPTGLGIRATPIPKVYPVPSPGQEIAVEPNGLAASIDALTAVDGDESQVEGWAAFPEQHRAPDHLLLADYVAPSRFRVVQSFPFARLERPDLAAHFGDLRLAYTGWKVRFPAGDVIAGRSLLAHDAHRNQFFHLALLPEPNR